jgi:ribosome maturation factor RimP
MTENEIKTLVKKALAENESLFLIDLKITSANLIKIIIDGDQGVPLSECVRINRFIENNYETELDDYSVEVSTPDIAHPLKNKRQYKKNIGRTLKVKTFEKEFEGKLKSIQQDAIVLTWKTREPKPIGKGKVTVQKEEIIAFDDIKETKVKIIF